MISSLSSEVFRKEALLPIPFRLFGAFGRVRYEIRPDMALTVERFVAKQRQALRFERFDLGARLTVEHLRLIL